MKIDKIRELKKEELEARAAERPARDLQRAALLSSERAARRSSRASGQLGIARLAAAGLDHLMKTRAGAPIGRQPTQLEPQVGGQERRWITLTDVETVARPRRQTGRSSDAGANRVIVDVRREVRRPLRRHEHHGGALREHRTA